MANNSNNEKNIGIEERNVSALTTSGEGEPPIHHHGPGHPTTGRNLGEGAAHSAWLNSPEGISTIVPKKDKKTKRSLSGPLARVRITEVPHWQANHPPVVDRAYFRHFSF